MNLEGCVIIMVNCSERRPKKVKYLYIQGRHKDLWQCRKFCGKRQILLEAGGQLLS